ncbi:MAG: aminoglycoside phosphotransferase [Actinobacteria bacterium]|nr:aminoglycoside phosphotransferase [Actinomycetota bacterium]
MPLPASIMAFLTPWMARQRWYAGKGRVPVLKCIGGLRLEDPAGEVDIDIHLLLDESGRTPTTYQVPLTCRGARLAGADHALVATVEHSSLGARYIYDAPHDPVFATALLARMGHPGEILASHVLNGEQSNTSIIIDLVDALGAPSKPLICKLFRVLHHGDNPDVVVQSALAAAGSTRVPRPVGHVVGQWPDAGAPDGVAAGHLAFAQEFLPGVDDAWRVALAAAASGADFSERARSLGQATAQVHATLAQAMGTREASDEDIAALTRSMRTRHASAVSEVPALAAYDSMVHASIEAVSSAKWPALQRIHGDYHLGQVLDVPDRGWVLVDFEGEPLRPLAERTEPDLALRDVAGMLRSFDYVAGSWEQTHPGRSAAQWSDRARTAFLEGYAQEAGRDPRQDPVLLNALELDKALYEVVYEARNRPTWLSIPTTAIARLFASRRSDLRL